MRGVYKMNNTLKSFCLILMIFALTSCGAKHEFDFSTATTSQEHDFVFSSESSRESAADSSEIKLSSETKTYTITWKNWDGSVLEIDYDVLEGTVPSYDGNEPIRLDDEQFVYIFDQWTPTVVAAYSDAVYFASFISKEVFEFDVYDDYAELKKYNGNYTNVKIPSQVNGLPVTDVNVDAFSGDNASLIDSLVVPNSVQILPGRVFRNLSSIRSITLPFVGVCPESSVGTLGYSLGSIFLADPPASLREVTITNDRAIGERAFLNCYMLRKIHISDKTETIASRALGDCNSLTFLHVPFTGYSRDSSTRNFSSLFKEGQCPTSLKIVEFDDSMTEIRPQAFYNTGSPGHYDYIEEIRLSKNTTKIGKEAFYGCKGLKSITIPEGVASIESDTFYGCTSLSKVVFKGDVNKIGDSAFYYCYSLTNFEVPKSIKTLGSHAFSFGESNTTAVNLFYNASDCNDIHHNNNTIS